MEATIIYNKSKDILCDVVMWNVLLEMSKEEVNDLIETNIVINHIE